MNLTSSARRSESPLQIGGRHGYRIDGDRVTIHAELSVPPYHPGGAWALQLWACEHAASAAELSGVQLGEVRFELPTPLSPHTHRVEAQVPARLPLHGRSHAMLLALVDPESGRVHDVSQYAEPESFPAPCFVGDVGYELQGDEVLLRATSVANPRAAGNLSGTLSIELWAAPLDAAAGAPTREHRLAAAPLAPVAGGEATSPLEVRASFQEPPPGRFQLWLRLREWTEAFGYATRDQRSFALPYEVATAPAPHAEPEERGVEAVAAPAPPPPAPAAMKEPPPVLLARASRAVSIQTASVEELARVKGLNTRIAKEIIRARPFASVDELLKVRGIGRKTLDKIRSLITL